MKSCTVSRILEALFAVVVVPLSALFFPLAAQTPAVLKSEQGINDPRAGAILQKVRKNLLAAKNIQIEFSYTEKNNEQKALLLAAGSSYVLKNSAQEIYCDGKTLYLYDIEVNEVSIYTYAPEKDNSNPLTNIKDYEKHFRPKYIREEVFKGVNCDIIDLIPLDGHAGYYRLRLHINKITLQPERFEFNFKSGDSYVFIVHSLKVNTQIAPNAFIFDSKKHPDILENDMR